MSTKLNVMLIHGAWSSHGSFNFITRMLDLYLESYINEVIFYDYTPINNNSTEIVKQARKKLDESGKQTIVVGHSMGGLVALAISDHEACKQVITMASPLSGIAIEKMFQPFIYGRAPILAELAPRSDFIKSLHKKKYEKRVDCIITTTGFNPVMLEKNDGVVSIASQESWLPSTAVLHYVDCNHYEILQSEQAFTTIKKALISQ